MDSLKIKKLRKEKNLSQETLAKLAGVPQRKISEAENGKKLHINTYLKIAQGLGISLSELFFSEEKVT
jgi:transcriptional regulator with XRE-family HTH domain